MPLRDWEEYGGGSSPKSRSPRASITRHRRLSLNQAAYRLLGCPARVALLYDARHRAIGIRAVTQEDARAYNVRTQAKGSSYTIGTEAFIRHHMIDCSQLIVFNHVKMENDILVLELDRARRSGRLASLPESVGV